MNPGAMDNYPSRYAGMAERVITRRDPVVYRGPDACASYECPVAEECITRYERDGFVVLEDVFSPSEVSGLRQALDDLRHDAGLHGREEVVSEANTGEVRSVFAVHSLSPVFARLAADERLVRLARYILGDEVYIHQSRLNYKPGLHGNDFYWHSDFETWHTEDGMPRMRALSMSVTLTDNDAFNGPLMLIPGSHREFVGCEGETPSEHYRQSLKKQRYGVPSDAWLQKTVQQQGVSMATARAGSVLVFDCNTMHGSNSNITPYPRSNAFFVYNAVSNLLQRPYCQQPPRPEYLATRKACSPLGRPRTGAHHAA